MPRGFPNDRQVETGVAARRFFCFFIRNERELQAKLLPGDEKHFKIFREDVLKMLIKQR